jgi:sugar lactone lactonase YvrE
VAEFPDRQVTGVAVSSNGRVFVNFPYWGGTHDVSVVEITAGGPVPYPTAEWNGWSLDDPASPERRFVCVQSVWVDADDTLWILDPASPGFGGVIPGGAKLVAVDLATDAVTQVYAFDAEAAPRSSYLNDLRIDRATRTAFMTDSGTGALLVLDLESGAARRLFEDHAALHAEPDVVPVVGGRELRGPDGKVPQIHSDGIALDPAAGTLYVHALTGRRLWSIPVSALTDETMDETTAADQLRDHGETVVTDGMIVGPKGAVLHSALEQDSIVAFTADGTLETLVRDPLLSWPDSFALSTDGWLYVTTSRIHESPVFGGARTEPYRVLRVAVE